MDQDQRRHCTTAAVLQSGPARGGTHRTCPRRDLTQMPTSKIFVTTDASDYVSGAMLSFGPSYNAARPVAYDSRSFKGAELNYPVHEKELLAIICALSKWRTELLGHTFEVWTDHRTLEHLNTQRDLSRRQARWLEFLSQFDTKIRYLPGNKNSVTDALSRLPDTDLTVVSNIVAATMNRKIHSFPTRHLDQCRSCDRGVQPPAPVGPRVLPAFIGPPPARALWA